MPDTTVRPELFVDLHSIIPTALLDLKYFTGDNFVDSKVKGYQRHLCLITSPAAQALLRVQHALTEFGLGIKVFDAYRPQQSVDHFIDWCDQTEESPTKARFFPTLQRGDLFKRGYLVRHSSHSRGSTVDLTLIDLSTHEELEMGTEFDYFGPESWIDNQDISAQARANRMLLQTLMIQHGFVPFQQEWWHFTLQDEPYSDTYFNFVID